MEAITAFASIQSLAVTAICTFVPTLIYFIYRFSIAEKSFEEVLEEQKQRSIEEELKQKSEKSKKEKKFKKSWERKKKEKVDTEIPFEPLIEDKEIPTIEIIEPKPQKHKNKKTNASQNNGAEKPKKVENSVVEKPKKAETNVAEKPKKSETNAQDKPTKVDVGVGFEQQEKKRDLQQEKVAEKPSVTAKQETSKTKVSEKKPKEVVEKIIKKEVEHVSTGNLTAGNVNKKKKKESVERDIALSSTKLLTLIKEAALDTNEIQNVIDVLLNKQKDASGWIKQNDQLENTKRSLHEKEQLLDIEHRQNIATISQLKDLRIEFNQLKTRYTSLEKSNAEKIHKQQQDIQASNVRMKQLQELCNAEKEKVPQLQKQLDEKVSSSVKKVEDEKLELQKKLSKLEAESQSGPSKSDLETLKKSKEDLHKVHLLLVEEHTQLVSTHKTEIKNLNAQLTVLKKQLEEADGKNDKLKDAEGGKKTLEDKLKNEEKLVAELQNQVKQLTTSNAGLTQLQSELKNLQLENERLAEQLVSTKERVAGDGQEIIHQNGEIKEAQDIASLKSMEDKEKLLKEKETLLAQLNDDLNKLKSRVSVLDEETEVQKKKNNELREKNWKAMDALKTAEESADQKLKEAHAEADKKIQQMRQEYENKLHSTNDTQTSDSALDGRLKEVQAESEKRLGSYNSELEKSKKLSTEVERINAQFKSAESTIAIMEKRVEDLNLHIKDCQCRTRECLQRLHPSISVDNSLPHDRWVEEFEKLASLAGQVTSSAASEAELTQLRSVLEERERKSSEERKQIEKVLSSTEVTLKELQEKAESKEVFWQERLNSKELELKKVLSEKEALIAEKDSIQSTIQQVTQLEELQDKLKLLQSTLETADNERSHIEQKYEEVNKNCLNLRDQLENKEKEISELHKDQGGVDRLKKDLEDLKSKLELEKKINKDFSSQMIRLNSLVKIGQDSLTAEQETVKKLKLQLESTEVATANGTTQSPAPVMSTQAKTKSSEKSKKKSDSSAKK